MGQEDHPQVCGWLVGGLWPSFESHGGAFDGLHMFGGTEPPRGQEKFNGSQRELLMAVSRGQNGSAQKTGGEEKNITGSRTGLSDQQMVLWQSQMGEVELNMDLPNLKIVPFSSCVCVCLQIWPDNGLDRRPNKRTWSTRS